MDDLAEFERCTRDGGGIGLTEQEGSQPGAVLESPCTHARRAAESMRDQSCGSRPASEDGVSSSRITMKVCCSGCKRCRATGRCFIDPDQIVRWLAQFRKGTWCNDCGAGHRTLYGRTMSLTVFVDYLLNEINFKKWQIELMAYVSF